MEVFENVSHGPAYYRFGNQCHRLQVLRGFLLYKFAYFLAEGLCIGNVAEHAEFMGSALRNFFIYFERIPVIFNAAFALFAQQINNARFNEPAIEELRFINLCMFGSVHRASVWRLCFMTSITDWIAKYLVVPSDARSCHGHKSSAGFAEMIHHGRSKRAYKDQKADAAYDALDPEITDHGLLHDD